MATDDVTVVIAYRDLGDRYRRRVFNWVREIYALTGWEVVVEAGTSVDTFTRASAINAGVRRATGAVIVQSDPDSLVGPAQLVEAVRAAAAVDQLVIPHNRYLYLDQAATLAVLDGRLSIDQCGPGECEFHGPDGRGNVVVFHRRVWERAGGFDERFPLWGGDDAAFAYACEAFCGAVHRLAGDVYHLWHPRLPQSDPNHPGYSDQFALLAQYRDAAEIGPAAVRDLVAGRL